MRSVGAAFAEKRWRPATQKHLLSSSPPPEGLAAPDAPPRYREETRKGPEEAAKEQHAVQLALR